MSAKKNIMNEISVTNNQNSIKIKEDYITEVSGKVLGLMKCDNSELSILLVDNDEMRQLNKQYRQKDYSTDVLSFPQYTDDKNQHEFVFGCESPLKPLGDIVISLETIKNQAEEFGHSFQTELLTMLIHGVLHLLGYDHENVPEEEYEKMKDKEQELLEVLEKV